MGADHGMDYVPGMDEDDRASKIERQMTYVSLHHHSTFSYLDGFQLPSAHVARAAELGMDTLALTEHGNVSSHVQLEIAAQKEGVSPIFGCELYTGGVGEAATQRKNHLTVLASDPQGYRNLLGLVTQGWSDFYYEPTVSGETLSHFKEGLIVLSGCTGSLLATSLIGGKNVPVEEASYHLGKQVARRYKKMLGDAYYLEVQMFPELENVRRLNKMIAQIGKELKIPLVATGDVHYTKPDEASVQQILHNVRGGNRQTLEEQARSWGYDVPLCPPLTDRLVMKRLRGTGLTTRQAREALNNTREIADRCNVTLPKLPQLRYPCKDSMKEWRAWIEDGWKYRGCDKFGPKKQRKWRKRLEYEMGIIEGKEFIDYFLVVSDLVKWSKDHGILVGPARGSAAASLVCYLLRITEVNPMDFPNLVFERFIDVSRADLPDVDLDFDSERRDEIRHYLAGKYGADCVGNIGSFTYYKSKNSLDDVARVYRIPKFEVEKVKELLIERSSGDLRADATIEDTVEQFDAAREVFEKHPDLYRAMELEGNIKGMGVHSAGLVVSNGPLTDVAAIYERVVSGKIYQVISHDKYDAERQNILKIDALGLSTMTLIAEALDNLGLSLEDLYALTFDDPAVIDAFRNNDTTGIFQFDGRTMRNVTRELKPDSFQEIYDINALARPGPLYNGATANYIDIKWGRKEAEHLHPILDEITKGTHFQIVYQEQILRIVREIGNFDWTHAAYIRKIISKKLGKQEFERQYEKFRSGAEANGVDDDTARRIWNSCVTAGSYAFNAAHCVSYGILAYWTMWLKVNHPEVFYAACLNKLPKEKHLDLLQDAEKHGIIIRPPLPSSAADWQPYPDEGAIEGGLSTIKGIGKVTAVKILEAEPETWDDMIKVKGVGPKTVELFKEFADREDPYDIHKLERQMRKVRAYLVAAGIPEPTHTSAEIPFSEGPDVSVVWMGVLKYRNQRNLFEAHFSRTGEELDPSTVRDPELADWVSGMGSDGDEVISLVWDRWKYPAFKQQVFDIKLDSDIIVAEGRKPGFQARRAVYVRKMWVFEMDEDD